MAPRIWRQHACRLRRCVRYMRLVFTVDRELARFLKTLRDGHRRCFTKMRSHIWPRLSRRIQVRRQAEHFITRILNLRLQHRISFSDLKLSEMRESFPIRPIRRSERIPRSNTTLAVSIGQRGEFSPGLNRLIPRSRCLRWPRAQPHRYAFWFISHTSLHWLTRGVTHARRRRSVSREPAARKHAFVPTDYACTVNTRVLDKDALASAQAD